MRFSYQLVQDLFATLGSFVHAELNKVPSVVNDDLASGGSHPKKVASTVDGRNPAPVDIVNIPLFTGFHTCWVVSRISSINSNKGIVNPPKLSDSFNFLGHHEFAESIFRIFPHLAGASACC